MADKLPTVFKSLPSKSEHLSLSFYSLLEKLSAFLFGDFCEQIELLEVPKSLVSDSVIEESLSSSSNDYSSI